jgi:nitroreductase
MNQTILVDHPGGIDTSLSRGTIVSDAVMTRRAVRAFSNRPVPKDVLSTIMDKARFAPSGCNFQPWEATILAGEPLQELFEKIARTPPQDPVEYVIQPADLPAEYLARLAENGQRQYAAEGIARDDAEGRREFAMRNFKAFGAPALLLCYLPRVMGPPQWSDVGMWLQTVMLLLREEGLDSCPQESLSLYGKLIKDHIGVSDETHIFFCGMAIGYRDAGAPVNQYERPRVGLDRQVNFVGF